MNNGQTRRFMAIEVTISSKGQTQIPDQTQLRGTYLDSIEIYPPNVAAVSAVTGSSNVATASDLKNMTLSLLRASDNVFQNKPLLAYNYINDGGSTPNRWQQEEMVSQPIDWNQSYIYMGATPSSTAIIVSIGVYYYNPNLQIPTDNMVLGSANNTNVLVNWVSKALSSMNGLFKKHGTGMGNIKGGVIRKRKGPHKVVQDKPRPYSM